MALTWTLTDGGRDLVIRSGRLAVVTGAEEVRQRILTTLLHHWQEYFLNIPAGLPWYELILGSKDRKTVEAIIRMAILSVPGVLSLPALQLVWEGRASRELEIYFTAEVRNADGTSDLVTGAVPVGG